MEILSQPIELAQKVCGSQKPCPGDWRMTHHCVSVPCAEGVLLYHTLTGELLLLNDEEWAARDTDPNLREALFRRRFLVPTDFDENRYADQVVHLAKLLNPPQKGITRFTVFTTLDCNARCFYCYQMGRRRPSMSVQTAHDTAAYMARVSQGQQVKIQWYGGEPLYNLGLCLKYQGQRLAEASASGGCVNCKLNEAYDWFYKATWNGGWQGAAYFACAQISSMQERWEDALYEVERSLVAGYHNQKARALKAAILRQTGRTAELPQLIAGSLEQDRFNYGILYERYLLTKDEQELERMTELMHGNPLNYHELALDYAQAGERRCAVAVLDLAIQEGAVNAMTYYYKTWLSGEVCALPAAPLPICFPNRLEDILALECVMQLDNTDAQAPYLLGCLYYDKRQYDEAMRLWERSAEIRPQFPTVWRNLALGLFNKTEKLKIETLKGAEKAVALMERAFHLDEGDARVLMELDQLYKTVQRPHAERLAFLQRYPELIRQRDDLVLEEITLLNQVGRYEEAKQKLDSHQFHPWEGGEGKVPAQYQFCRVELAKRSLGDKENMETGAAADKAISLLAECLEYPHHLGEGKLYGAQENDFYYLLGLAHEARGEQDEARKCWELATVGPTEPAAAMYYNDAKPDKIFYAALAYRRLGDDAKANGLCHKLINYGQQHLFDRVRMDYFAVSLPDLLIWEGDLQAKNTIHCNLMMALGHYGLGNRQRGDRFLAAVEQMDINHPVPPALRSLLTLLDSLPAAED